MIEASGLRKSYRTRRRRKVTNVDAVRGVDFAVQRGEIFGFLGPNGAGKTTTLRMLATLIRPDGGDATIAGVDLRRDPAQVRRHIGFVAQGSGTYDRSTARRDLVHQARMYGASKSAAKDLAARQPSRPSSSTTSPTATSAPTPAGSGGASMSRSASSIRPRSSSWTSRRPGWTRKAGPACGRRCAGSATRA